MHPQPLDGGGDGSSGFWFPMNMHKDQFEPQSQIEQNPNPLKRPRISEEYQSMNANATHPQNGPGNNNPKGTGKIFFKTRFCAKFKHGMCRNGESCNFAHGDADLRQPPPNWQEIVAGGGRVDDRTNPLGDDDQKIIHRLKLCKKFYKGEECPYGDRCNFIHKDPARLSDDPGRLRESSAISIGITATTLDVPMVNGSLSSLSAYWKTKLCTKFETTGQCPFGGTCHFAHGVAELQVPEAEAGNAGGSVVGRSQPVPCASPCVSASVPMINEEGHGKRRLLNINGSKKINGIYGDWLDDFF